MSETINKTSDIEIPKWYGDLRAWREEHGCTGPLWDTFAFAAQERVKMVKMYFGGLGFIIGYAVAYVIAYIQK